MILKKNLYNYKSYINSFKINKIKQILKNKRLEK